MDDRLEPWPHQEEIIQLAQETNVFLADDTGAGKTISSIEAAHRFFDTPGTLPSPILVICTKSAKLQWVHVIRQQYPDELAVLIGKHDKDIVQELRREQVWLVAHFHVFHDATMYQYMNRQVYSAIIIDEAHRIKGHRTIWANRIRNLKARRKIAATATPQEKSVADMFNTLQFLRGKKEYPSYWRFVERYCYTKDSHFSDNPEIQGTNPQMMAELSEKIAPFYRRRMKTDVREDMPPLIEQRVPVPMERPQEQFYRLLESSDDILLYNQEMLDDPLWLANKLSLIMRLWQCASYPATIPGSKVKNSGKILWVNDFIRDNPDESLIIFTHFRDTAIHLAEKWSDLPPYIGGHDNPLPTPDNKIIVGTIGSMGESLDLPWINTGIFVNRSRSNIQMKQAKDRIYRMNIEEPKRIMYLEAHKERGQQTIDHVIRESLQKKWSDAEFVAETIKSLQLSTGYSTL